MRALTRVSRPQLMQVSTTCGAQYQQRGSPSGVTRIEYPTRVQIEQGLRGRAQGRQIAFTVPANRHSRS